MAVEIHKFGRHYLGSAFLIVIFVYNYKQKNNLPAINRGDSWQVNIITPSIMKMQQAFSSYDSVSTTMEICSTVFIE